MKSFSPTSLASIKEPVKSAKIHCRSLPEAPLKAFRRLRGGIHHGTHAPRLAVLFGGFCQEREQLPHEGRGHRAASDQHVLQSELPTRVPYTNALPPKSRILRNPTRSRPYIYVLQRGTCIHFQHRTSPIWLALGRSAEHHPTCPRPR